MENNALIEQIISELLKNMSNEEEKTVEECKEVKCTNNLNINDFPLSQKRNDLIKTKNGRNLNDITIENVLNGTIGPEDIKITAEVLLYQAQIAEDLGRIQFSQNLKRAAELTVVPDERVLEIYNSLRPYRSTKQELLAIADELDNKYNAKMNASLVREACEVYEKRNRLKV